MGEQRRSSRRPFGNGSGSDPVGEAAGVRPCPPQWAKINPGSLTVNAGVPSLAFLSLPTIQDIPWPSRNKVVRVCWNASR